jgi:hypothetical protein
MKKTLLILFVLLTIIVKAQEDKTVTLTVSGTGKTLEEAKTNALRSAIEQAFGAFISSKTEILNDNLVKDEIVSVTNGNIQSFEILNESQLLEGTWTTIIKATISIDKLTSFVEAKGVAIEIKGALFALNIKQQLLNENAELKAITEMVNILHKSMQVSFDYDIKSSNPKSLDSESKFWEIPITVNANFNKNINYCSDYCIKTLSAISLLPEEVNNYKYINKEVFRIVIDNYWSSKTFYLRKQNSINLLILFSENIPLYIRLFKAYSNVTESHGIENSSIYEYNKSVWSDYKGPTISFLPSGYHAATFLWHEKLSLNQLEQLSSYKIEPRGEVSKTLIPDDKLLEHTISN